MWSPRTAFAANTWTASKSAQLTASTAVKNMLVINPSECIDCGVCEPECPAKAIVPDSDDRASAWAETNATYSGQWPRITRKGQPPTDADEWKDKPDKGKLFSAQPAA
jgi:ferredoxin